MSTLCSQLQTVEHRLNLVQDEISVTRLEISSLQKEKRTPHQNERLQVLESRLTVLYAWGLEEGKNYGFLLAKEQALRDEFDGLFHIVRYLHINLISSEPVRKKPHYSPPFQKKLLKNATAANSSSSSVHIPGKGYLLFISTIDYQQFP